MVVLTSNSKISLEQALADRPGRIDHTVRYDPPGPVHRKAVLAIALLVQCLPPEGGLEFALPVTPVPASANAEAVSLLALYVSREISYDISRVKPVA